MKVASLCYLSQLTDEDIQKHNCSDRIWLSSRLFEDYMRSADPGIAVILLIENAVGATSYGAIYGIHTESACENTVFIPEWMFNLLSENEEITLTQVSPSMCTSMTVQPYTSDHISAADPQQLLSEGFEYYTCITKGEERPIWLGDHSFMVNIVDVAPAPNVTVCIRNCEIRLDLLPPLDLPPTAPNEPTEPIAPNEPTEPTEPTAPETPDAETVRQLMRAAVLRRLGAPK
jgi:hypothetical protein